MNKLEAMDLLRLVSDESPLKPISKMALDMLVNSSNLEIKVSDENYEGKRSSALKNLYLVRNKRPEAIKKNTLGLLESIDALSSNPGALLRLTIINLDQASITLWVNENKEPFSILIDLLNRPRCDG